MFTRVALSSARRSAFGPDIVCSWGRTMPSSNGERRMRAKQQRRATRSPPMALRCS